MSELSQKLREALALYDAKKEKGLHITGEEEDAINVINLALIEYEKLEETILETQQRFIERNAEVIELRDRVFKLEREASAGRIFVAKMQELSDSGDCGRWLEDDLTAYRTACGEEK